MQVKWLGWAGVELESDGATVVIDPLDDASAVFAAFAAAGLQPALPQVVPATPGTAVAALVTHLHRDHTDAAALRAALAPGGDLFGPAAGGGGDLENLGLAQAEAELAAAGLVRTVAEPWQHFTAGPFTLTALPAADGIGDPQIAWLVEAGGVRVLHLGDTMFHGGWWRMALRHGPFDLVLVPVNGAVVRFPHRRPASPYPVDLDPQSAVVAVQALGARLAIPIHAEGYEVEGAYVPVAGATDAFLTAAAAAGVPARALALGEAITVEPATVPA